jgi:hypothetical protein
MKLMTQRGSKEYLKKIKTHLEISRLSDDLDCWFVKLITLSFVKLASPDFKVRPSAIFKV